MNAQQAESRVIFDTVVGSVAYGLNTPESDCDTVAVCIPAIDYFFGRNKFEQVVYTAVPGEQDDRTVYDLRKIVGLMLDNNPNCLDILFAPERCIKKTTPYWESIRELRDSFVSKKCRHTFAGYSFAQLQRIKTHRAFLLNPPKAEPTREEYELPENPIFPVAQLDGVIHLADDFFIQSTKQELVDNLKAIYGDQVLVEIKRHLKPEYREIAIDLFRKGLEAQLYAIKSIGNEYIKEEYKEQAIKELAYAASLKGWKRYLAWKSGRNKKRAELEARYGFDLKHASHLVRLLRMCQEILSTGKVNVDRTHIDADELRAIKNGAWSYDKVEEYANSMDAQMTELYKVSTLRSAPDRQAIDARLISVIQNYLTKE